MRRLVTLTAILVSLVTATACEARGRNTQTQNVSNPRPVHCTIIADGPKRDAANPPRSIVGRVRFRCDRPGADRLTLAVRLEQQNGTGWRVVKAQTFTLGSTQSHAEFFKYQNRQVTTGCTAGKFRTIVDWSRSSRGKNGKGTTRSGTIMDPCAPRIFT